MPARFVLILAALATSPLAQVPLAPVGPRNLPQEATLITGHFDGASGWLAGEQPQGGFLLRTRDGGATWEGPIPVPMRWPSILRIGGTGKGFLGGSGGLYETEDGGGTWMAKGDLAHIASLHFPDQTHGYAALRIGGEMARTADGGMTWERRNVAIKANAIQGLGPAVVFAAGGGADGHLYVTRDSGGTWNGIKMGDGLSPLIDLHFPGADTGYTAGYNGILARTVDGGRTWAAQSTGFLGRLTGIRFFDGRSGYAVGDSGILLRTRDGGATWTLVPTGTREDFLQIRLGENGVAYVIGSRTVFRIGEAPIATLRPFPVSGGRQGSAAVGARFGWYAHPKRADRAWDARGRLLLLP